MQFILWLVSDDAIAREAVDIGDADDAVAVCHRIYGIAAKARDAGATAMLDAVISNGSYIIATASPAKDEVVVRWSELAEAAADYVATTGSPLAWHPDDVQSVAIGGGLEM